MRSDDLLTRSKVHRASQLLQEVEGDAHNGQYGPMSLSRALRAMTKEGGGLSSVPEYESFRHIASLYGRQFDPHRVIIPFEVCARAMATVPGSKGGYAVGVDTGDAVDVLRPFSPIVAMGTQIFPNLQSNITIPRTTTKTTATWQAPEGTTVTPADPVLGAVSLQPRTAIIVVQFSYQLFRQSNVDAFLGRELIKTAGNAISAGAIAGTGASGQLLGLTNVPGVQTQSGTTLNAGCATMKRKSAEANVTDPQISFLSTPAVRELLEGREKATGGGNFVWQKDLVADRPAYVSTDVPTASMICGDWSTCVLGIWGPGFTVEIDPNANFNNGMMAARIVVMCDFAVLQPASFVLASSIT